MRLLTLSQMNIDQREFVKDSYKKFEKLPKAQRNKKIIENFKKKFHAIIDSDSIYEICIRNRKEAEAVCESIKSPELADLKSELSDMKKKHTLW